MRRRPGPPHSKKQTLLSSDRQYDLILRFSRKYRFGSPWQPLNRIEANHPVHPPGAPGSRFWAMTYLNQQMGSNPAKPSNRDQGTPRRLSRIWRHLFECALCHIEFGPLQIVPLLPEPLHSVLLPHPTAYGFEAETHSFLHRMIIRRRKRFGAYFLSGFGPSVVGADGLRHQNIRVLPCTSCMRNFVADHP